MVTLFTDLDPYETLEISPSATPIEIKKSYKKLCLKHHPDKKINSTEEEKIESQQEFEKVQFAYSVLGDPHKRQVYDSTGSLESSDDQFNWKKYFDNMQEKITIDMIEEDKLKYQGSEEEATDIVDSFIYYEGDFLKLFEVIPHLEFSKDEESRVFNMIEEKYKSEDIQEKFKLWKKYCKNRKSEITKLTKKLNKEEKEAEKLKAKITSKKLDTDDDLKAIILRKQKSRMDDLINNLEAKYGGSNKKRKRKAASDDIDDDVFERIQQNMMSSNKARKSQKSKK